MRITLLASGLNVLIVRSKMEKEDAFLAKTIPMLMRLAINALQMFVITLQTTSTLMDPAKLAMPLSIPIQRLYSKAALLMNAPTVLTTLSNGVTRRLVEPIIDQIMRIANSLETV
jgi:hypothetical protein